MKDFWKKLVNLNKRDLIGFVGWLTISIVFGLISIIPMVLRETYQYKHYRLLKFEWEDIVRYGIAIIIGSVIHYMIILRWIV